MKIGLPRAMLYYRFSTLWDTFFKALGCDVIVSGETNKATMDCGIKHCIAECCLPMKVFLGHVEELKGKCDYILVPRFERLSKSEEFCVRLWGLPDVVKSTFPAIPILTYNLCGSNETQEFIRMGKLLGQSRFQALKAYRHAKIQQEHADELEKIKQEKLLLKSDLKVLLVAQPYIINDGHIGKPMIRMIREQGAEPVFADKLDHEECSKQSKKLSEDLYWTMNKETIGAIPLTEGKVDGIILLTAFPCGTDSLVNELVLRRTKTVPIINIILDEQQGKAGLQTRIECFVDILKERRNAAGFGN